MTYEGASDFVDLNNLNDQQNHLLTQLSYRSHLLTEDLSLAEIYSSLSETEKQSEYGTLLEEMISVNLGGIVISDIANDSLTGFGALAFTDSCGNTGISYRGSDGIIDNLNDWIDNYYTFRSGVSPQTAQAESFYLKNMNDNGNNFLYGHSKGGELSQAVYVNHYSEIKAVHCLNPQPINPYALKSDQIAALNADKVDIVVTEGDVVWFMGAVPYLFNIRIMKKNGGSILSAHSYVSSRYVNGYIVDGEMPIWECIAFPIISRLAYTLQVGWSHSYGFVYGCVVRIANLVSDGLWRMAMSFINDVGVLLTELSADLKEISVALKDFLVYVAHNMAEWVKTAFDSGYRTASENPEIEVDTAKLRNYADKLRAVNRRLATLDRRMDSLYWEVGLRDLYSLLRADVLTGSSRCITRCEKYLTQTAEDFERLERDVANLF